LTGTQGRATTIHLGPPQFRDHDIVGSLEDIEKGNNQS